MVKPNTISKRKAKTEIFSLKNLVIFIHIIPCILAVITNMTNQLYEIVAHLLHILCRESLDVGQHKQGSADSPHGTQGATTAQHTAPRMLGRAISHHHPSRLSILYHRADMTLSTSLQLLHSATTHTSLQNAIKHTNKTCTSILNLQE